MRPRIVVTKTTNGNISRQEISVAVIRLLIPLCYNVRAPNGKHDRDKADTGK